MSRVDVIVPCYRYGRFLPECLGSILTQSHRDVRVLIIDDASPDDSAEVARQIVREDERVQLIVHPANRGHLATYNEGLAWADGDYLMILSADDLLTPGSLARAVRILDAHAEVGLVYGRTVRTDAPSVEKCSVRDDCKWRIMPGVEVIRRACEEGSNVIPTQAAIVRASLQKKLGGYRAELPHTADMEMWLRFAAHAPVAVLDTDQAFYRVHGTNMHIQTYGAILMQLQQHKAAFDILFNEYAQRIPDAQSLHELSLRSTAANAIWAASSAFDRGDKLACAKLIDYALQIDPMLKSRAQWRRFRIKRMLGPRIWTTILPLVNRLRGRTDEPQPATVRIGLFPAM